MTRVTYAQNLMMTENTVSSLGGDRNALLSVKLQLQVSKVNKPYDNPGRKSIVRKSRICEA